MQREERLFLFRVLYSPKKLFLDSVFLQIMKYLISRKTKFRELSSGSWMILKAQICKLCPKKI